MTAAEPVPLPEHIVEAFWDARCLLDTYDHRDELCAAFAAVLPSDVGWLSSVNPRLVAAIQADALDDEADKWDEFGFGLCLRVRAAALRDQTRDQT